MAQMKAYNMPMKNLTLFCGKGNPRQKVFKKWMCTRQEIALQLAIITAKEKAKSLPSYHSL